MLESEGGAIMADGVSVQPAVGNDLSQDLREVYLGRLRHPMRLRIDHREDLNDAGLWLLDRAILTIYLDCRDVGCGVAATEALRQRYLQEIPAYLSGKEMSPVPFADPDDPGVQNCYLARLRRLLGLRKDHEEDLNDSGLWLLDKSILATFRDCVEVNCGLAARGILRRFAHQGIPGHLELAQT